MRWRRFSTKFHITNIFSIRIACMWCLLHGRKSHTYTKNIEVEKLNNMIVNHPREKHNFLSFDEIEGDTQLISTRTLALYCSRWFATTHTYILKLKKWAPLMSLRNINPKSSLCTGTKLLCRCFFMNLLDVEILIGSNIGKGALLSRIEHKPSDRPWLPFVLNQKLFPVRLAITINKSRG